MQQMRLLLEKDWKPGFPSILFSGLLKTAADGYSLEIN